MEGGGIYGCAEVGTAAPQGGVHALISAGDEPRRHEYLNSRLKRHLGRYVAVSQVFVVFDDKNPGVQPLGHHTVAGQFAGKDARGEYLPESNHFFGGSRGHFGKQRMTFLFGGFPFAAGEEPPDYCQMTGLEVPHLFSEPQGGFILMPCLSGQGLQMLLPGEPCQCQQFVGAPFYGRTDQHHTSFEGRFADNVEHARHRRRIGDRGSSEFQYLYHR